MLSGTQALDSDSSMDVELNKVVENTFEQVELKMEFEEEKEEWSLSITNEETCEEIPDLTETLMLAHKTDEKVEFAIEILEECKVGTTKFPNNQEIKRDENQHIILGINEGTQKDSKLNSNENYQIISVLNKGRPGDGKLDSNEKQRRKLFED